MMKRILILQNTILHYRKPLYNKLAEQYDVTVLHSGKESILPEDRYKEIIAPLKRISKFYIQKGVKKEVKKGNYDVIITMMDIQWINNVLTSFFHPKSSKFAWWGIIVSKNKFANKLRGYFLRNKPTIFYTEAGLKEMKTLGFTSPIYTYCNNTFHIENRVPCYLEENKNSILFVGSLDKRKRLDLMLKAFTNSISNIPMSIKFKIIGSGSELESISNLIKELNIEERVQLLGKITDTMILQNHYKSAICSLSFGQAGLGVLQSMGYGVPFVTSKNAISGGEISNIIHDENGLLCDHDQSSLENALTTLCNDIQLSKRLGNNAFQHYSNKCTIEQMASKFIKVIET